VKRHRTLAAQPPSNLDLGPVLDAAGTARDEAIAVLSDALLSANDPWGAVMAAQSRGDLSLQQLEAPEVLGPVRASRSRAKVRVVHGLAGGPFTPWLEAEQPSDLDVLWRNGFVDTLEFRGRFPTWVNPSMLDRRPLAGLRALLCHTRLPKDWDERPDRFARLEVLDLGEISSAQRCGWIRRLPRLRCLAARVGRLHDTPTWPEDLHHPTVRSLCVRMGVLTTPFLEAALNAFPSLEDLVLVPDADTPPDVLKPLLSADLGASVKGFALLGNLTAHGVEAISEAARRGRFRRSLWVDPEPSSRPQGLLEVEVLGATPCAHVGAALRDAGLGRDAVPFLWRALRDATPEDRLDSLMALSLALDDDPAVGPVYEALHRWPASHGSLPLTAWRNHVLTLCPVEERLRAGAPIDLDQARAALDVARRGLAASEGLADGFSGTTIAEGVADLHHLAAELLLVLNGDATEEFERSVTIRRSLVKDGLVSPENRFYLAVGLCRLGRAEEAFEVLIHKTFDNPALRAEALRETGLAPLRADPRVLAALKA
jgi:hypothetical protein